ncbi:hypothetical protein AB0L14_35285 [Streptomyces sp. NPDC052727]|uniref:hypothetical protein n=1 Tax=Streptomyces sp. NPDC052727 TaxID=3154854 RepID=UPI00341C5765
MSLSEAVDVDTAALFAARAGRRPGAVHERRTGEEDQRGDHPAHGGEPGPEATESVLFRQVALWAGEPHTGGPELSCSALNAS